MKLFLMRKKVSAFPKTRNATPSIAGRSVHAPSFRSFGGSRYKPDELKQKLAEARLLFAQQTEQQGKQSAMQVEIESLRIQVAELTNRIVEIGRLQKTESASGHNQSQSTSLADSRALGELRAQNHILSESIESITQTLENTKAERDRLSATLDKKKRLLISFEEKLTEVISANEASEKYAVGLERFSRRLIHIIQRLGGFLEMNNAILDAAINPTDGLSVLRVIAQHNQFTPDGDAPDSWIPTKDIEIQYRRYFDLLEEAINSVHEQRLSAFLEMNNSILDAAKNGDDGEGVPNVLARHNQLKADGDAPESWIPTKGIEIQYRRCFELLQPAADAVQDCMDGSLLSALKALADWEASDGEMGEEVLLQLFENLSQQGDETANALEGNNEVGPADNAPAQTERTDGTQIMSPIGSPPPVTTISGDRIRHDFSRLGQRLFSEGVTRKDLPAHLMVSPVRATGISDIGPQVSSLSPKGTGRLIDADRAELSRAIAEFSDSISRLYTRFKALDSKLSLEENLEKLIPELEKTKGNAVRLEEKVAGKEKTIKELRERVATLQEAKNKFGELALQKIKMELNAANKKAGAVEELQRQTSEKVETLNIQIAAERQTNNQLTEANQALLAEVAKLKAELLTLANVGGLRSRAEKAEQEG